MLKSCGVSQCQTLPYWDLTGTHAVCCPNHPFYCKKIFLKCVRSDNSLIFPCSCSIRVLAHKRTSHSRLPWQVSLASFWLSLQSWFRFRELLLAPLAGLCAFFVDFNPKRIAVFLFSVPFAYSPVPLPHSHPATI